MVMPLLWAIPRLILPRRFAEFEPIDLGESPPLRVGRPKSVHQIFKISGWTPLFGAAFLRETLNQTFQRQTVARFGRLFSHNAALMQTYQIETLSDQIADCYRTIALVQQQQSDDTNALVERLDLLETRHVRYLRSLRMRSQQNRRYVAVCLLIGVSAFLQALPDTFFEAKPAIISALASMTLFILTGKIDGLLKHNFNAGKHDS